MRTALERIHWTRLDSELVKPVLEPTLRLIKNYAPRILTVQVDRLLQEVRRTRESDISSDVVMHR